METIADIKTEIFSADQPNPGPPPDCTVMIVDDNLEIIAALKTLLREDFRIVSCVNSGEVEKSLTADVKVVLLDIKMAGNDGVEIFGLLKKTRPDLKIIFHTAYPGSAGKAAEVQRLNHNGYLTKGNYNLTHLLNVLRRVMNEAVQLSSAEPLQD